VPRRVFAIRPLTSREMSELHPCLLMAPVSNLLPLTRIHRRPVYEI
jgi:hypothetical protein